jgi:TRAP transporter 4TM/12TM fusion protein
MLPPWNGVVKRLYLTLPLISLIIVLSVFSWSAVRAAMLGIAVCIAVSMMEKGNRITPKKFLDGLSEGAINSTAVIAACGTAGIVIGMLNLTGSGMKFASAIIQLSQGRLAVALVLTMLACLIMGMGLPTSAAYILCAAVAAPTLVQIGLDKLTAHMFIFVFACISAFTPPVCTAAYAAAGIAQAPPMKVAVTACKIGCAAFIIPYMFAFGPALLWQGSMGTILLSMVTSLLGCMLLSFGIQGCVFRCKANILMRLIMAGAAICLIMSGIKTDLIGLAFGAAAVGYTCVLRKNLIAVGTDAL